MPVYYNDGLDDPVQYDRQASFVGGQISNFRENLLNESQAESLKDLDAPKNGVLKSRRGFHRFADLLGSSSASTNTQALAYFDTDAKEALIAFVNAEIFSINNVGAISTTGLTGTKINNDENRVYTAQVSDKLFFSNYTGTGKVGQISWDTSGSTYVVKEAGDAAPVNAKYLVSNNYRIFAYQPSDDQIYVSEFLPNITSTGSTTIFDGTGNLPFKVGLGDPVTGLASWVGFNLVVFARTVAMSLTLEVFLRKADLRLKLQTTQSEPSQRPQDVSLMVLLPKWEKTYSFSLAQELDQLDGPWRKTWWHQMWV